MLITQSEFARLAKVSRSAVCQAVKAGLITATETRDGKIYIHKDEGLSQYENNSKKRNKPKRVASAPVPPSVSVASGLELLSWGTAVAVTSETGNAEEVELTPPTNAAELKIRVQGLPDDAIPDLNESRARREHYQAELAKLQVSQQRRELVSADEVKAAAFRAARSVRDSLMALPDRLAAQLAGTNDVRLCHTLLTEELRVALRSLADG